MPISLAGGASTQSRGRRPCPPGWSHPRTNYTSGVWEWVGYETPAGLYESRLLSWVGGQWGGLFGSGPFPASVQSAVDAGWRFAPGTYGHVMERQLAEKLGDIYAGLIASEDLSVRFFQNGSDACAAAARVARAVTVTR